MTAKSHTDEALRQMQAANPISIQELRHEIADDELDRAMRRSIEAGAKAPRRRGLLSAHRGATLRLGAGLASIGVIAALILVAGGSVGGGSRPAFAAAAIEVAEANPRLLVAAPGWSVTSADEFEADEGEMTFSDGIHWLEIHWYPAHLYQDFRLDRADVSTPVTSTLLGQIATTIHYGGNEYATMLPPRGSVFVEIRGALASHREYETTLRSLHAVDIDTWLNAMPPSVVRPDARAATVEQMLRGIPLPPEFDLAALQDESSVLDRYQLGAKVTGAVACDWLDRWVAATDAGEEAAAQVAVEAMATSPHWPILRQMADEGGWSSVLWSLAREIQHGHLQRGISAVFFRDGKRWVHGPGYATALGCDSQYTRQVDP